MRIKDKILFFSYILFAFLLLGRMSEGPVNAQEKKSVTGNLKICFIIDTSDSMNVDRRFIRVKKAMMGFIDSLIENDYFIAANFDTRGYLIYSGIVADGPMREAIKRVFESNFPEGEKVKGMATQIKLGLEEGFKEIENTPPYETSVVVLFVDGDHNPIPDPEEWKALCSRLINWRNQAKPGGYRAIYVVDAGDPINTRKLAEDLQVGNENYFPYDKDTDFAEILAKIRGKIPYHFDVRVFPSEMNLGQFEDPKNQTSNKIILINNPDFIKKGGKLGTKISYYKDGKPMEENPPRLNLPEKIDSEFFSCDLMVKFPDKKAPAGNYKCEIAFEPQGDLNTRLSILDEKGLPIEKIQVGFTVLPAKSPYTPFIWAGAVLMLLIILILLYISHYVKNMPAVKGKLVYSSSENCDVLPQSAELFQRQKFFIFTGGRNMVTIGARADVNLGGIPFIEPEHFQLEATHKNRYQVKPVDGVIEVLDERENPRGGKNIKDKYLIRIINKDNPKESVTFRFENRQAL